MIFTLQAGAAVVLVTLTLGLQCAGMTVLIEWARDSIERGVRQFSSWRSSVLMIRFTTALIVLHFLEIVLWAGFYRWRCLPTWESSFYFSATSYSTVGYGDLVLPHIWRLLGPVESVAGVLVWYFGQYTFCHHGPPGPGRREGSARNDATRYRDQPRAAVSVNDIG